MVRNMVHFHVVGVCVCVCVCVCEYLFTPPHHTTESLVCGVCMGAE
jgi:hypothetical protein